MGSKCLHCFLEFLTGYLALLICVSPIFFFFAATYLYKLQPSLDIHLAEPEVCI